MLRTAIALKKCIGLQNSEVYAMKVKIVNIYTFRTS